MFYQKLLATVASLTIAYGALCLGLYVFQTRLIFKPTDTLTQTPADIPVPYEEVWIAANGRPAELNEGLHGWWLPALPGRLTDFSLTLLYLHGNSQNIGANLGLAHRYQRMGLNVLLVDYRGYGLSLGPFPSEMRVYEDAIAAYRYLTETRQIPQHQLWLFGHSLGGAIAIDLASHRPAAGLIVQSSFSSMRQVVALTDQYSWMPIDWILTQQFDSIEKVPNLRLPVLYIHGLEDDTIVPSMSQQLYTASPDPKQLWLVPGAGHNDVAETSGDAYFTMVETFIQQTQSPVSIQPPVSPVE